MPLRTKLFQILPWIGGVNTSIDEAMIEHNELVRAENVIFDTRNSKKVREGINFDFDSATAEAESLIGLVQFNYETSGTTKDTRFVSVSTDKVIYAYDTSTRSTPTLDGTVTAWADSITKASFETINNLVIIAVDGATNEVRKWAGDVAFVLPLAGAPKGSIVRKHLGRLWMNDKENVDRLHYSTTANPEEWNGVGDSGALDIGIGDGDPEGITAIFPTFHGDLFVAKKTKLYRVSGFTPETFSITLVSDGIGCLSHNSVTPVDQTDIFFVSERGVHSLNTTSNFGDYEAKYLSAKIQKTFNDKFSKTRLDRVVGGYVPELNSVLFAFSDTTLAASGNNTLWLYNIEFGTWYTWPNISCESMMIVRDSDRIRPYFGTNDNRLAKSQGGEKNDKDTTGAEISIPMVLQTGVIFPEKDPYNIKGFKKFSLIFKPAGTHTVTAEFAIDNFSTQNLTFSEPIASALLGVDFILGVSTLGFDIVLAPFTRSIDGYGRGFQLTLTHDAIDQDVEIQGFSVEYEPASTGQEVIF